METITADKQLETAGFYWRSKDGVRALVSASLEQAGFVNGFSTRLGGVSPMPDEALNLAGFNEDSAENILENRRRFLKLFPGSWLLTGCWQVHGSTLRIITNKEDAQPPADARGETVYCDALVGIAEGVLLAVKTADCVPILLGDPKTAAFSAVHAGWRGTLAGIVGVAIERMVQQFLTKPADILVAIGPAATECCYEVGAEVIEGFTQRFSTEGIFRSSRPNHAFIDLIKANKDQLVLSGINAANISVAPLCTMCRTDLFFSYRREKKIHGRVGRLMSVIGRSNL